MTTIYEIQLEKISKWENIVAVSVSSDNIIGLKSDGTVVGDGGRVFESYNGGPRQVTSRQNYGQFNVLGWENVVAIYTSAGTTVGLKADGTVVATGLNVYGQCNVSDWTDIRVPEVDW